MSHFSQIKTKIRNLPALQSALTDLGVNWKSGPEPIRGYQGQVRSAELVVAQDNGYDVGFSWSGQEYELVADLVCGTLLKQDYSALRLPYGGKYGVISRISDCGRSEQ
jgi:Protein of unknown function (DUF1257)